MHRWSLLLPVLLLAGCAAEPAPSAAPAPRPSAEVLPAAPAATALPPVAVYWLGHLDGPRGPRLYREWLPGAADPVAAGLTAALSGEPADPDYGALWPAGTRLLSWERDGTTAVVDLSGAADDAGAGAAFEAASLQQLVHTVTANDPAVTGVRLLVEGEPVETLWGHVDASAPLVRAPAAEVLGPVWLDVAEGGALGRTVSGTAAVFEATVSWRLLDGDRVAAEGFATASAGAPLRGAWEAEIAVPAGSYVLEAWESSAEDGSVQWLDSKAVRVS